MGRTIAGMVVALASWAAWGNPVALAPVELEFTANGSSPGPVKVINNIAYFAATTPDQGTELWRSDGTVAGTSIVKDICPGPCAASPAALVVVGTTLYFAADDGVNGRELWKSDGTAAGTVLVKNISGGSSSSDPGVLVDVNGTLFFVVGNGLWKSDGTSAGTVPLATFLQPPTGLVNVNGVLFFAGSGAGGIELWKSDGTVAGTVVVADINPGPAHSSPTCLTSVNGKVVFAATGAAGSGIWRSDGTAAGTTMLPGLSGTAFQACPVVSGSQAYFAFAPGTLWRTDGTAATALVTYPSIAVDSLRDATGQLYLQGNDGVSGTPLYRIAPILSPLPQPVLFPGAGSLAVVYPMVGLGSRMFFTAASPDRGQELWVTDGTTTSFVQDIEPGPAGSLSQTPPRPDGAAAGNQIFFRPRTTELGAELWVSDGTDAGTHVVKDIAPGRRARTPGAAMAWTANGLYFAGASAATGIELWRTDGTVAGTHLVLDRQAGAPSSAPGLFGDRGGTVLYAGNGTQEIWRSDGTTAGTWLVRDNFRGFVNGLPVVDAIASTPVVLGGVWYFVMFEGTGGGFPRARLWRSDGTTGGTFLVKDVSLAFLDGPPIVVSNGILYFAASDAVSGFELWRSDGTAAGTFLVKDIQPGANDSSPQNFVDVNGVLYFTANRASEGLELWKSDGTAAGTVLVADIFPGSTGSAPSQLTAVGNVLYFSATDAASGTELWKSDGTPAGTVRVKDIATGAGSSNPTSIVAVNGTAYFTADDGVNGRELWKSDGTAAGTVMVKDISPGASGSDPQSLTAAGGVVYFSAIDATHGRELWRSDGTSAGTQMVVDLYPGAGGSDPASLTAAGSRLFFTASDGVNLQQLYVFSPEPLASEITMTPPSLAFGNQGLVSTSASQVVTLSNASINPAAIGTLGTTGDFVVTSTTCGATIAAGSSCTVNVAFRPMTAGARSGSVVALVGTTTQVPYTTLLFGTGLANAPVAPTLAAGGATTYGSPASFSASLSVATSGTVFFYDGGNFIGAAQVACGALPCTATFSTRSLVVGSHSITAQFLGNAAFAGGTSAAITHTVTAAPSATVLVSTSPSVAFNTPVAFTAAVASAGEIVTGTVAFTRDGAPIAGCTAVGVQPDGTARCTVTGLSVGSYAIASSYSGDGNNGGSTSNVVTQAVTGLVSALTPSEAVLDFGGQSINTTAPAITVSFTNASGVAITISGASATAGFAVAANGCGTLAAGSSCAVGVTFTPAAQGGANGTLTLATTAGTFNVALAGIGERSLVTHYYRSILRRAPDAPGKAFWTGEATRLQTAGANVNEAWFAMAQSFYSSPEYVAFGRDDAGFVTDLYNTFFNRAPDGPGLAFWTGQIPQGMPREVVLAAFMFSAEFTGFTQAIFGNTPVRREIDTVMDFYRGLLGRTPDAEGLAFWIQQFRAAQCVGAGAVTAQAESISSAFATGSEYAGRSRSNAQYVGDLYNAFLRRGGDLGGVQFWINAVNTNALTREQVRQQFVASGEFQARVQQVIAQGCLP